MYLMFARTLHQRLLHFRHPRTIHIHRISSQCLNPTTATNAYRRLLPHEVFLQPFPSPPTEVADNFPESDTIATHDSTFRFRVASKEEETLSKVVRNFSYDLRYSYPRRVIWPENHDFIPSDVFDYFQYVLLDPTLSVLYKLRYSEYIKPIVSVVSVSETNYEIIKFHSDDFELFRNEPQTPLAVIVRPGSFCGVGSEVPFSHALSTLLSQAWDINPNAYIICTDLKSLAIFHPPTSSRTSMQDVVYERVEPMSDLRTLSIVLGSYIYRALPKFLYIALPEHPGLSECFPDGAIIDPKIPMKSDEEIFSSCHRHADFDQYMLFMDRRRALQFLRWKQHVADNISPLTDYSDEVLSGVTDGFIRFNTEFTPIYPFYEPPPSTMDHLDSVRRPCPLGPLRDVLLGSQSFTVKLGRLLTPGRAEDGRTRMYPTYTCRLVSVDGRDIGDDGPVLCLKLYDDRFYALHTPADAMDYGDMQSMMFDAAEAYICREIAVYEKLDFAQGSIIPYFYGVHLFTMRDGLQVYGTLMEYVDAFRLDSGVCWSFSERQKIQLVQSARHAVRILQYGDISKRYWRAGQILAHRAPTPSDPDRVYCVLVDFSAATQSLYLTENHRQDDFGSCTTALIEDGTGLFEDFVMEHMGPREVWDFFSRMTGVWRFAPERKLPDPFAFIHTSQAGIAD